MQNLTHSASLHSLDKIAPSKSGIKHLGAFLGAIAPPLSFRTVEYYARFRDFLSLLAPWAVAAGLAVLVPCLMVRGLRLWCVAPTLLAALLGGVIAGERVSQHAMCEEAMRFGVTSFPRNSLLWSLANTPDEFQFEIHARLEKDGMRYGWSYREMTWYQIPRTAWDDVTGPLFDCAAS